jgi:hypothetical protein
MVSLLDVVGALTPVALAIIGWGVRLVWSEIKALREEQREYVRQETCRVHRELMQRQIDDLRR